MIQAQDANTSVSMFEGGEVDAILTVSSDYLDILSDSVVYYPFSAVRAVQFNTYGQGDEAKAALLSNDNFRKALSYAINREAVNYAVDPTNTGINRYMFAPMSGKSEDSVFEEDYPVDTVPMTGDEEAAKEYLQAALDELGYASVDELPALSYLCFENDSYRLMAETLVDQWYQILGLTNITIDLKPIPDAIQQMMSYQYDMYYTSMSSGDSPSVFLTCWITGGSINDVTGSGMSLFSNEEYDSLVKAASSEFDREARMDLYAQAEQILIDEAPLIMINTSGQYTALADYVDGFMYNTYDSAIELNYLTVNK
jgi:oligopeptide transport system substrate-binding protein